jgi:hypothetical protein
MSPSPPLIYSRITIWKVPKQNLWADGPVKITVRGRELVVRLEAEREIVAFELERRATNIAAQENCPDMRDQM